MLPLIAIGTLALSLLTEQWASNVYLHGTEHLFGVFRHGPHGLVYLSDPRRCPGRQTQAQAIAGGPFGGFLYEVRIRGGKRFDPLNDPVARQIALQIVSEEDLARIHYTSAPELVRLARPHGYTHFEIWEPSVRCWSTAIADPTLLEVVQIHDVRPRPVEPWRLSFDELLREQAPMRTIARPEISFEVWLEQSEVDPATVATEFEKVSFIGGTLFALPSRTAQQRGKLRSLQRKVERRNELLQLYAEQVPQIETEHPIDVHRAADLALVRTRHKRTIRRALREGKRVPEHVLADYPELTRRPTLE